MGSKRFWINEKVLGDTNTEIYSTEIEGKCAIPEKFIKTFKNRICKYLASISKDVFIDKLDNISDYNNTVHSTIKIESKDDWCLYWIFLCCKQKKAKPETGEKSF